MLRMRPLDGSTTTTLPAKLPSAATAARRIVRSSPSTLSPRVGSTPGTWALYGSFLRDAEVDFFFRGVEDARPTGWSKQQAMKRNRKYIFMQQQGFGCHYSEIHRRQLNPFGGNAWQACALT